MNWKYNAQDDYYVNPVGVRFNFRCYAYRNDKYGFRRDFKVYQAEKYDENHQINPQALTVHTGYKMLENTDLKLSVFQHFFILVSY